MTATELPDRRGASRATPASLRLYLIAVLAGWVVLGAGAWEYARMKAVPGWAAVPSGAAILIEFPFYLAPGFADARERLAAFAKNRLSAGMAFSALIPYLSYSVPTGVFNPGAFALLALISITVAFWYVFLPRNGWSDAVFLMLIAAIILARMFHTIYADPIPKLRIEYLGHVMLIRLAAMEILTIRGGVSAEFRFWPNRKEWITGLRWFAVALPCAGVAYWALGFGNWRPDPLGLPLAIATFFGMLWVVALSEEFFFRGLLQNWLQDWLGSSEHPRTTDSLRAAAGEEFSHLPSGVPRPVRSSGPALVLASILFGAAHLAFGHVFPNWRFAAVAGITGIFYGLAWRERRSVQASMVTHALLVTVWRVFLK